MLKGKAKISLRQALIIFLTSAFSPAIRFIPMFSANKSKQAAWLTPLPSLVPMIILIFILSRIFKVYKDKSMMESIYDIMGRWIGKFVVALYFLWSLWLIALYLRYDVERLVSSTYPNIDISVFAIITVALIAYVIPKGITLIGRMSEILFPIIFITFVLLCIFLFPNIRLDSIRPISTKDIIPIIQGSYVTTAIGTYFILLFFFGEFINDKEKLFKSGLKVAVFYILMSVVVILVTIGTLTSTVTQNLLIPFLVAVKQISVLNTIEKIESLVVGTWIFADFILLSFMVIASVNMLKSLVALKDTKNLLNIFLILVFFLALGIATNPFELSDFSMNFLVHLNFIFGVIFPIIIFIIGKLRKKI